MKKYKYQINFNKTNRYANETADVDFSQTHSVQELTMEQVKACLPAITSGLIVYTGDEEFNPMLVNKDEIDGVLQSQKDIDVKTKELELNLEDEKKKVVTLLSEIDELKASVKDRDDKIVVLEAENKQLTENSSALGAQVLELTEKNIVLEKKLKKPANS